MDSVPRPYNVRGAEIRRSGGYGVVKRPKPALKAEALAGSLAMRQSVSLSRSNQMKPRISRRLASSVNMPATQDALSPPASAEALSAIMSGRDVRASTAVMLESKTCANDCHTWPYVVPQL